MHKIFFFSRIEGIEGYRPVYRSARSHQTTHCCIDSKDSATFTDPTHGPTNRGLA